MKTKILLLIFALGVAAPQVEAQGLLLKVLTKTLEKKGKIVRQDPNKQSSTTTLQPPQENSSSTPSTTATPANKNDEVTLVVSADGTSKEKATKVALRSAIEQAYGTFVSANTTLLNDELVKDEIVTVSSGNIKEYKEIASNVMPDGKTFVTLQATVCISKLVSYAQSKGAETEFAGATFAMNMKMKELNKQNEMKVLQNLLVQVKELLPTSFDKKLVIKDPIIAPTSMNSSKGLAWYDTKTSPTSYDKNVLQSVTRWEESAAESYLMEMQLQFTQNKTTTDLQNLILSTLSSLSLTNEDAKDYRNHGMNVTYLDMSYYTRDERQLTHNYMLRNTRKDIMAWCEQLSSAFYNEFNNYKIVDNTGEESYFDGNEILKKSMRDLLFIWI